MPTMLLRRNDSMTGVVHIHDNNEKPTRGMIIYGPGYLCDVNFTRPLPPVDADLFLRSDHITGGTVDERQRGSKTRKKKGNKKKLIPANNFRMIDRYRPIYWAVSLGSQEMLVVEKPWIKVLRALPLPVYRKKYGKS